MLLCGQGEGECVEELNIYRRVARISKKGGETAIILGFCNPMISDTTDLWQLLLILTVCSFRNYASHLTDS